MARMSSVLLVRNPPSFHPSVPMFRSLVPRKPASTVRATTCFSGGSDTRNAAIRQGRAGSAQPSSSRGAIGFRIAGVCAQFRNDLVGTADDRVEPLIGTVAIERGANLILERDTRIIEPSTRRHRECIGDIEGVERVEPAVLIGGADRDGTKRHRIARSPEKYAASANNEVGADGTEFGARRKIGHAGIERRSEHELVIVPE